MSCYLAVLEKYAVFTGRARRREYWYFFLFNILILILLAGIDAAIGAFSPQARIGPLSGLYSLAVLIPGLAVSVRRLHDTNRSGWWILIALVPLVGAVGLLVFLVQDSQTGQNQYGPSPKAGLGTLASKPAQASFTVPSARPTASVESSTPLAANAGTVTHDHQGSHGTAKPQQETAGTIGTHRLFCTKCGVKNPADANFCYSCGGLLFSVGKGSVDAPDSTQLSPYPPISPLTDTQSGNRFPDGKAPLLNAPQRWSPAHALGLVLALFAVFAAGYEGYAFGLKKGRALDSRLVLKIAKVNQDGCVQSEWIGYQEGYVDGGACVSARLPGTAGNMRSWLQAQCNSDTRREIDAKDNAWVNGPNPEADALKKQLKQLHLWHGK